MQSLRPTSTSYPFLECTEWKHIAKECWVQRKLIFSTLESSLLSPEHLRFTRLLKRLKVSWWKMSTAKKSNKINLRDIKRSCTCAWLTSAFSFFQNISNLSEGVIPLSNTLLPWWCHSMSCAGVVLSLADPVSVNHSAQTAFSWKVTIFCWTTLRNLVRMKTHFLHCINQSLLQYLNICGSQLH